MFTKEQKDALELMINAQGWEVLSNIINESRLALYQEALHGVAIFNGKSEKLSPTERTERLGQIGWLDYILNLPKHIIQEQNDNYDTENNDYDTENNDNNSEETLFNNLQKNLANQYSEALNLQLKNATNINNDEQIKNMAKNIDAQLIANTELNLKTNDGEHNNV